MDVTSVSVALTRLMECPVFLTPSDLTRSFGVIRVSKDLGAAMFPPRTTQRKYIDSADRWEVMIHNCKADGSALHYDPEYDLRIPLSERSSKAPPAKKPETSKKKSGRVPARGAPAAPTLPAPLFLALPPPATLPPPPACACCFQHTEPGGQTLELTSLPRSAPRCCGSECPLMPRIYWGCGHQCEWHRERLQADEGS